MQRFAEPEPVKRYAPGTPDQLDQLISQLLSKEPADRFPNVLVLGRHMEAMKKALSRPHKKEQGSVDSKIGSHPTNVSSDVTAEIDEDATKALNAPILFPNDGETDEAMQELFDAPTLAESAKSDPSQVNSAEPAKQASEDSQTVTKRRFTTIDEEVRREREQARDSKVWRIAQLVGMVVAIGILIWGGKQLMQPPTAERLYEEIISKIDQRGSEDLQPVKSELEDFLARFPEDPHREEMEEYFQQLKFQKFERQARRKSRSGGTQGTNPVEIIYRTALSVAESDPALGLEKLHSLLALYDPTNQSADAEPLHSEEVAKDPNYLWLVLTRKQVEELTLQIQQQSVSQLPLLKKRLEMAAKLHLTEPKKAAKMVQAIVDLYENQPWAETIVKSAKLMLTETLSNKTDQ